jgi:hypothetical protein
VSSPLHGPWRDPQEAREVLHRWLTREGAGEYWQIAERHFAAID